LTHFLIQAKHHTYAGQGDVASVAPLLPGTRQLEYRDGLFFYRDIYVGMAYFVGQEIVYYADQPIWSMSYAGGSVPTASHDIEIDSIYTFLRMALRQVSAEQPYRGPQLLRDGPYLYTNYSQGPLEDFWGHETIAYGRHKVYELHTTVGVSSAEVVLRSLLCHGPLLILVLLAGVIDRCAIGHTPGTPLSRGLGRAPERG
jgi:hypothetical protein